ncbi:MAG: sulfatase-like hydrolase/transferase, partial [Cyclobacteriaceae bacterium]|nr:sulfatase-like hydrolase/transferase [Cyclobacteriaceae bacterium]
AMNAEVINAGEIFRDAGYHTVWAGKWHLPESYPQRAVSKQKEIRGFDLLPFRNPEIKNWMLGSETDPDLTEAVVDFIDQYDAKAPFFLAVSYHNPHDICFYPRKAGWVSENDSLLDIRHYGFEYRLPDPVAIHPDHFPNLPPLPANHEISKDEPAFIADKRTDHNEYGLETKLANQEFSEKEWRGYYHAYCRLTEMVDVEIGKVMMALAKHGYEENTIVVFTSDHGDGAAAHKWAAKLSLYEESSKIPLILSWPGQITAGLVDQKHLVSQIDILPTLCDYAGIDASVSFTGESLRAIVENPAADWREYLVVELADYKPDSSRKGRMLRSSQYK